MKHLSHQKYPVFLCTLRSELALMVSKQSTQTIFLPSLSSYSIFSYIIKELLLGSLRNRTMRGWAWAVVHPGRLSGLCEDEMTGSTLPDGGKREHVAQCLAHSMYVLAPATSNQPYYNFSPYLIVSGT
jgi:hypothetical protein